MIGDHKKKGIERKIITSSKQRRGSSEVIGSSGKIVDGSSPSNINPRHKKRRQRVLVLSSRSITSR